MRARIKNLAEIKTNFWFFGVGMSIFFYDVCFSSAGSTFSGGSTYVRPIELMSGFRAAGHYSGVPLFRPSTPTYASFLSREK
jgi:hypothetical protein